MSRVDRLTGKVVTARAARAERRHGGARDGRHAAGTRVRGRAGGYARLKDSLRVQVVGVVFQARFGVSPPAGPLHEVYQDTTRHCRSDGRLRE